METSDLYAGRDPIAAVVEGMTVVDGAGKQIGSVDLVEPGYVKVKGKGLFGAKHTVMADQIADVRDDTVTLTIPEDQLS